MERLKKQPTPSEWRRAVFVAASKELTLAQLHSTRASYKRDMHAAQMRAARILSAATSPKRTIPKALLEKIHEALDNNS